MKRKVSRVEAMLIMQAARQVREAQAIADRNPPTPAPVELELVPVEVEPVEPKIERKRSIFSYLIDLIKKKGT